MNLRMIKLNYAAELKRGFSIKSILELFELTSPFRQRGSKIRIKFSQPFLGLMSAEISD